MSYLLLGVLILLGLWFAARVFVSTDPRSLAQALRWTGVALAAATVIFLVATNRAGVLFWAAPLVLPFIARLRIGLGRKRAAAGPTDGQTSNVETEWLSLWLDHDSGTLGGEVRRGAFAGRGLHDLDRDELFQLLREVSDDPQSRSLLETYLDRGFPDWRSASNEPDPPRSGTMDEAEALSILGLEAGADEEAIREAHRRLMLKNHPDRGGSTHLAAQINRAKDTLLARRRR